MKVFIVRHGESEANKKGLWTGWLDALLTEKGEADAMLAREVLEGVKFDKIYSSDLVRATRTAEIAIPGCEYEATPLLRETNVGSLTGKEYYPIVYSDGRSVMDTGYGEFGGESTDDLGKRVSEFMRVLENCGHERVAAFSHGGYMMKFLDLVVGKSLPRQSVCCKNCTVAIFEYKDSVWRLHSWINLS